MSYLLGIDLGTSATKTVLFDTCGRAICSASREYPLYQPQNGWAEQDPYDWWNATIETTREVIAKTKIDSKEIKGIGISGQMHGLVMLDKNGEVLRKSIIWCDGRTTDECKEITETIGQKRLIEITANPALTGFTAGKILWVRKNEPEIYERCAHILLPKDYIRYKLCNVFATEVSDASGMNLLDVKNRCWSDEVLKKLDISKDMLGKMYESCEITGKVTDKASKLTGLYEGIPVVGGAGDNAAAAIGTGIVEKGNAFTTIGTSGVVFAHTDNVTIDLEGRVHTFCSAVKGCWTVMSCTLAAGLSLKWFRDQFCESEISTANAMDVDPYYLIDKEAEKSPIGANRLIFLPYLMGERSPILDEKARGAFIGLSAIHKKRDMIRAVLEGVIFAQKDCLDVFDEMNINPDKMIACGGGAASPLWKQIMADVYDCHVYTVDNKEGPALGVAILAGVGVGIYSDVQSACKQILKMKDKSEPIRENTDKYAQIYNIYKQLYPALKEPYKALSKI